MDYTKFIISVFHSFEAKHFNLNSTEFSPGAKDSSTTN